MKRELKSIKFYFKTKRNKKQKTKSNINSTRQTK